MQIIEIQMSLRGAVDDAIARALAVGGLTAVAIIHGVEAPDAFGEVGYLGALFVVAVVACVSLASVLTRTTDDRAWMAAGGLAGLILLGYVLSRSVGLPGFTADTGEWAEPAGLIAMVLESTLVVLSAGVLVSRRGAPAAAQGWSSVAAPAGPPASSTEHPAF